MWHFFIGVEPFCFLKSIIQLQDEKSFINRGLFIVGSLGLGIEPPIPVNWYYTIFSFSGKRNLQQFSCSAPHHLGPLS